MNADTLSPIWANCIDILKDRVNNRSFWEALEKSQAVTIEGGILIIGLDSVNFNRASHILQTSHFNAVHKAVAELFQQSLQVRVIEGCTLADWAAAKDHDTRVLAMKQASTARRTAVEEGSADTWESVSELVSKLYLQSPNRNMPQGKARYANEALYFLVEAMDTLYGDEPDESTEKNLARALDRIAHSSEIPAPVLAFELERLRAWRKTNPETVEN